MSGEKQNVTVQETNSNDNSSSSSHSASREFKLYATHKIARRWYTPYLICISFITGLIDATTILGLDGIFVANQTGNLIYLACGIGDPHLRAVIVRAAVSLATYCLGGFLGSRIANTSLIKGLNTRLWMTLSSIILVGLLVLSTALLWTDAITTRNHSYLAAVAILGLGIGIQVVTSRGLGVSEISSNVLTGTFTDLFGDMNLFALHNEKRNRRIGAILSMFLGALVGAFAAAYGHPAIPLVISAGIHAGLAVSIMLIPDLREEKTKAKATNGSP